MNMISTSYPVADHLKAQLEAALQNERPADANWAVTCAHYALGQALKQVTGPASGANFHAWAVWGSQKAGSTIRQEDLHTALRDAHRVSGLFGGLVGGFVAAGALGHLPVSGLSVLWWVLCIVGVVLGAVVGALTGGQIAKMSRQKAASLILAGNKLVLEDIGQQTVRFIRTFETDSLNETFWEGFCDGPTQTLLKDAFRLYARAAEASAEGRAEDAQRACYHANLRAILHEHIKLQPYIEGSMPWIIRRCVTQRLMTYAVGSLRLAVGQTVPSLDGLRFPESLKRLDDAALRDFITGPGGWGSVPETPDGAGARDWSKIDQRMRYIVNLFRVFHLESSVLEEPERAV